MKLECEIALTELVATFKLTNLIYPATNFEEMRGRPNYLRLREQSLSIKIFF